MYLFATPRSTPPNPPFARGGKGEGRTSLDFPAYEGGVPPLALRFPEPPLQGGKKEGLCMYLFATPRSTPPNPPFARGGKERGGPLWISPLT